MKTRIFIFIIILAMLVACIGHLDSENDFMIRVGTGFKERTGKDYIQCWVNDSLVFNKSGYDSLKIKIRVTSLDTVLYCGKRVIDSTFRYRIDNIPNIVISCSSNGGILLWDTLRTPDYFWLEY